MIIEGKSVCAACNHSLHSDGRLVSFAWIDTDDPALALYSDAGAHFECLSSSDARSKLSRIYLEQLGPDGEKANGSKVVTISDDWRVKARMGGIIVRNGSLFFTLEMPRETAVEFVGSDFWHSNEHNGFSGSGFAAEYRIVGSNVEFAFRCFPYAMHLSDCVPGQIQFIRRVIRGNSLESMLTSMKAALQEAIKHEKGQA
jgi:hypothetical protein